MDPVEPIDLGREDMEEGMRSSSVGAFSVVAVLATTVLLTFNSQSLVDWTRQPQAGPGIEMLEGPAVVWNELMKRARLREPLVDAKRLAKRLLDS